MTASILTNCLGVVIFMLGGVGGRSQYFVLVRRMKGGWGYPFECLV